MPVLLITLGSWGGLGDYNLSMISLEPYQACPQFYCREQCVPSPAHQGHLARTVVRIVLATMEASVIM